MLIATWNVNSIRVRLPRVLDWLREMTPDTLLLQETKTPDQFFPRLELQDIGYHSLIHGEKSYNGVAILSRRQMEVTERSLPGADDDKQARYLEVRCGDNIRIASLYLPNGNPVGSARFAYKMTWMARLYRHARTLLQTGDAVILGGDYNVCPTDDDVYAPEEWAENALCRLEARQAFQKILLLGYCDAFRFFHSTQGEYTFWSYQGGAWSHNMGLRIDHLLLSPQATNLLEESGIDKRPRGYSRTSDHAPVWCRLREVA